LKITKHVTVRVDPPASTRALRDTFPPRKVSKSCEQNPFSLQDVPASVAHRGHDLIPAEAAIKPTLLAPESTAHANLDEQKSSRLEPEIPEGTPASDEAFKPDGPPIKSALLTR
jgi:hypothetical protein